MPPSTQGSAGSASGPSLERVEDYFVGRFAAMASPCEVLVDTDDRAEAEAALRAAAAEAARIERKYSRYRPDGVVHEINQSGGWPVTLDEESAHLIDYASTCYEVSEGLFDITSGVLRRAWTFDGGDHVPEPEAVRELLEKVGWHRATWRRPVLTLPDGMEIDLGGLGKEYAVDRASAQVAEVTRSASLVNFGGDLYAGGERRGNRPWSVGVDDPGRTGEGVLYQIEIARGGLATSGDARRFVTWKGRRLGHVLDPRTGWPVEGAPSAVTVIAETCLEAGTLSTLACLRGAGARAFLEEQGVQFRLVEAPAPQP